MFIGTDSTPVHTNQCRSTNFISLLLFFERYICCNFCSQPTLLLVVFVGYSSFDTNVRVQLRKNHIELQNS